MAIFCSLEVKVRFFVEGTLVQHKPAQWSLTTRICPLCAWVKSQTMVVFSQAPFSEIKYPKYTYFPRTNIVTCFSKKVQQGHCCTRTAQAMYIHNTIDSNKTKAMPRVMFLYHHLGKRCKNTFFCLNYYSPRQPMLLPQGKVAHSEQENL